MTIVNNEASEMLMKLVNDDIPEALVARHGVAMAEWKLRLTTQITFGVIGVVFLLFTIFAIWWLTRRINTINAAAEASGRVRADWSHISKLDSTRFLGYITLAACVIGLCSIGVSLVSLLSEYYLLSEPKAWALDYIKQSLVGVPR